MNFKTQCDAILEALNDKESTRTLLRGMLTKLSEIHDRQILSLKDELSTGAPIDKLWKSTNGERLIELAYRQDPRAATRELNALNGSGYRIAQELRDRKLMKERELPGAEAAV